MIQSFFCNYKRKNIENITIIGNGISRKNIDLTSLGGITIGCNLLYKDFMPTILVSICRHIILDVVRKEPEVLKSFKVPQHFISTIPYKYKIILKDNDCIRQYNIQYITSGNFAIDYAIKNFTPKNIHLIGFDNDTTNMYYGNNHYSPIKNVLTSTNWEKNKIQLNYILRKYKRIVK